MKPHINWSELTQDEALSLVKDGVLYLTDESKDMLEDFLIEECVLDDRKK